MRFHMTQNNYLHIIWKLKFPLIICTVLLVVLWHFTREETLDEKLAKWKPFVHRENDFKFIPKRDKTQGFLTPIKSRDSLGELAEHYGCKTGAEIGVFFGNFSYQILKEWPSMEHYYLIDPWEPQTRYFDLIFNHSEAMDTVKSRLSPWLDRITLLKMTSYHGSLQIEHESLDFIYLDARHDYCSVKEDLDLFWPKLRPGGIFSGHDYRTNSSFETANNWHICPDGQIQDGAVKRAVDEFAVKHGLVVTATYMETDFSASWIMRKPLRL